LRGEREDIGDHLKKDDKGELLEHQIWPTLPNMIGLWG
jgi:hypothetical protein